MSSVDMIGGRTIDATSAGSAPEDATLVRRAQVLLNRIAGTERIPPDGDLDERTVAAITRFQSSADLPPTGALDAPTLRALEREADRAIRARDAYELEEAEGHGCVPSGLPGGVDADAGVGVDSARSATGAACLPIADRVTVELALDELHIVAGAFARDVLSSAPARLEYQARIAEAANEILARVESGAITPAEGAAEAYAMRNIIRGSTRESTTRLARAWAEAASRGHSLGGLIESRARELFSRPAESLSAAEREVVLTEVIRRSGGARVEATTNIARWSAASRAVVVVAIALSVYRVVTADDISLALGDEAAGWLGGMAGWAAGSYAGALLCGEAAPVCVGAVAITGAVAGDVASRALFESVIEEVTVPEGSAP